MTKKIKLIVILGPTSSGKTSLAVKLARQFHGEIISADSRQVYCGMDVGTGKDLAEYGEIKHHLLDVVEPQTVFSLAKYKRLADQAITEVSEKGKTAFLVGGSGLYLQAVVDDYQLLATQADQELRMALAKLSVSELFEKLKSLNLGFANKLAVSDQKNQRRLIRYIEINQLADQALEKRKGKYDTLLIGLEVDRPVLNERIRQRLIDRLEKQQLIEEVRQLQQAGLSWSRLESFGLEYKFVSKYLQDRLTYEELVEKLFIAIRQFAKRQMTWFKRWQKQGQHIHWLKDPEAAEKLISEFIKN